MGLIPQLLPKRFLKFGRLTKIDLVKREVSGIFTDETPDKTGEIFDYSSSLPYYKNWSDSIAKATEGKSLGNVREMHQLSAVGKVVAILFEDDKKEISGTAKIVDDNAWKKCCEGVYTGFSHGGDYIGKVAKDGRYTASPSEISIVDNPANPSATFQVVRADGTVELRKFHAPTQEEPKLHLEKVEDYEMTREETVELVKTSIVEAFAAQALLKKEADSELKKEKCPKCGKDMADCTCTAEKSSKQDVCPKCGNDPCTCTSVTGPKVEKGQCPVCKEAMSDCKCESVTKTEDSSKPYGDVQYADDGMQTDKKKRYPVDTPSHIRAAWNYVHKDKNASKYTPENLATVKSKIVSAWKEKIDPAGPPSAEKVSNAVISCMVKGYRKTRPTDVTPEGEYVKFFGDLVKVSEPEKLDKGMHQLRQLADILLDIAWLRWVVEEEQLAEGDKVSPLPEDLLEDLTSLAQTLVAMADEETRELVAASTEGKPPNEIKNYGSPCGVPFFCAAMPEPKNGLYKASTDEFDTSYDDYIPNPVEFLPAFIDLNDLDPAGVPVDIEFYLASARE